MTSTGVRPRKWWRRVSAAVKDNHSILRARARLWRCRTSGTAHVPDLEAAIIKATSHDEDVSDYVGGINRVLSWAKTHPSSPLDPLMWALARRLERTSSWVVALKGVMLMHGILLCSKEIPEVDTIGRLPFDLSGFRDRYSNSGRSWGFTAFVRAYFNYVDHRSTFLNHYPNNIRDAQPDDKSVSLQRLESMQNLLEFLMQIKPYGDGMEVHLVMEAMDCVVAEIFDVYSDICNSMAHCLLEIADSYSFPSSKEVGPAKGLRVIRVLKRAAEQSARLSAYFDVCSRLGVLNSSEVPKLEQIPEEDIQNLELMVMSSVVNTNVGNVPADQEGCGTLKHDGNLRTIVTKNWVVFDDDCRYTTPLH